MNSTNPPHFCENASHVAPCALKREPRGVCGRACPHAATVAVLHAKKKSGQKIEAQRWVSQKTVPSDKIMIGGSLVLGRDTSAISRPPCVSR